MNSSWGAVELYNMKIDIIIFYSETVVVEEYNQYSSVQLRGCFAARSMQLWDVRMQRPMLGRCCLKTTAVAVDATFAEPAYRLVGNA